MSQSTDYEGVILGLAGLSLVLLAAARLLREQPPNDR